MAASWLPGMHPLIAQISQLHWYVLQQLGQHPRLTSGFRSYDEQAALYMRPGKYPVSTPGYSQHEYGLAYDLVADDQDLAAYVGELLGMVWSSTDPVHFAAFKREDWKAVIQAAIQLPAFGDFPGGTGFPEAGDD